MLKAAGAAQAQMREASHCNRRLKETARPNWRGPWTRAICGGGCRSPRPIGTALRDAEDGGRR